MGDAGASPWGNAPSKPGKFAKNEEGPTPQQAMRIDSRKKFKVLVKFSQIFVKIFLKLSKIFKLKI